jgi:hypothetical protein
MDLIWAFPVYLLAISLSTVLLTTPGGVMMRSRVHVGERPLVLHLRAF